MPAKKDFEIHLKFNSIKEFEQSFKEPVNWKGNRFRNCTLCKFDRTHKMREMRGDCENIKCNPTGDNPCRRQYRANICQVYFRPMVYTLFEHNSDELVEKEERGIHNRVKTMIDHIVHNYSSLPYQIHLRLNKYRDHLDDREIPFPTLKQVQNYINYRRLKIGDNNNIEDLQDFLETIQYEEGVTKDDEIFEFGTELGNGAEENHFHLGFTSLKLLQNVKHDGVYHFDLTYKIVKYNYPLMILGVTDIRRQFHPISFMFTSHEQEMDIAHFFKSLSQLCDKFSLDLAPKFFVIDADRAVYNAINKHFKTKIIMCFFHLKQNIKKHKNLIPKDKYSRV